MARRECGSFGRAGAAERFVLYRPSAVSREFPLSVRSPGGQNIIVTVMQIRYARKRKNIIFAILSDIFNSHRSPAIVKAGRVKPPAQHDEADKNEEASHFGTSPEVSISRMADANEKIAMRTAKTPLIPKMVISVPRQSWLARWLSEPSGRRQTSPHSDSAWRRWRRE